MIYPSLNLTQFHQHRVQCVPFEGMTRESHQVISNNRDNFWFSQKVETWKEILQSKSILNLMYLFPDIIVLNGMNASESRRTFHHIVKTQQKQHLLIYATVSHSIDYI